MTCPHGVTSPNEECAPCMLLALGSLCQDHVEIAGIVLDADEARQLTVDDQHLVEDIITALRTPGQPQADHHHMLVMDLLQALVEVAELRGDRASARRHVMKRLELQKARAAGQGV